MHGDTRWTTKRENAHAFATCVEVLFFCFNHHSHNMQILGDIADTRMNFSLPVTDFRGG